MKQIKTFVVIVTFLLLLSCANNSSENKTATTQTEAPEAKQEERSGEAGGDGLVGEWQLTGIATDDIRNSRLDEAERKNAMTQVQDYLKLNSDGSCLFYAHKVKGRYKLKTESDCAQLLTLYDKDGNKENRGKIFSVSKDELVLFKAGSTFSIYKRL